MNCCGKQTLNDFSFPPDDRWIIKPWGRMMTHFTSDDKAVCYKTLIILPGEQLSVQRHEKRSEVWYVPDDTAKYALTLGDEHSILHGQRKIDIPLGYIHCMKNLDSKPLVIYEMQTGYCDENDIIRVFDPYNRK